MLSHYPFKALLLMGLVFASLSACDREPAKAKAKAEPGASFKISKATIVEAISPRRRSQEAFREYGGEVFFDQRAQVHADVSARVMKVHVQLGDKVKADDVLVELDETTARQRVRELDAAVRQAQASIKQTGATLTNLKRQRDLRAPLLDQRLISQDELDELKAQVEVTQAQQLVLEAALDQAQARLRSAREELGRARIKAPIDGIISARQVELGQVCAPNAPLLSIIAPSSAMVRAQIPERELGALSAGMKARVLLVAYADRSCEATLARQAPALDTITSNLSVELSLAETCATPAQPLREGMHVRLRVELDRVEDALVIPQQTVLRKDDGGAEVWVVRDGKATIQEVELGLSSAQDVQILKGLTLDDKVILRGQERLKPGAPVTLTESADAQGAKP